MHQSLTKTQNWTSFLLSCYFIMIFVTSIIGQSNAELQNNFRQDSKVHTPFSIIDYDYFLFLVLGIYSAAT